MRIAVTDRLGHTVAVLTGSRLAVAGALLAGVTLMCVPVVIASPGTPVWPALLLLSGALLALADSDSHLGLVLVLLHGLWWLLAVPPSAAAAGWALVAATGALVLHLVLAHEASGPGGVTAPHTVLGSLLSGAAGVLAGTAVLAGLVALAADAWRTPAWVVAMAVVLLAALPWVAHADQPPEPDDD